MQESNDINRKVERALESLDGISKAAPAPFLYTRIKARMSREEKTVWEKAGYFLARPIVAVAILFLVLGSNAYIILNKKSTKATASTIAGEVQADDDVLASNTYDYITFDQ